MKTQTIGQMLDAGATAEEAAAAMELFRVMRPSLKIKRDNGRIETTHGDKNILGWFRTMKDLTGGSTPLNNAAPDMLEALQELREGIEMRDWQDMPEYKVLIAAIHKATGGDTP